MRNEAKAAMKDKTVSSSYKDKIDNTKPDPPIEFRNWYNSTRSVRKEFVIRAAKRLEVMRRATVALHQYHIPEAPMFQEVLEPLREGAPPVEERIRLYGSRYPEAFTWEEVLDWYSDNPATLDLDDAAFQGAEAEAVNERRRLKLLETERERQTLETDICMWEDHRSHMMRIAMNEMKSQSNAKYDVTSASDILSSDFAYFGEIPKEKETYEKMSELKYTEGTGLDNQDEFSDGRERAKAEAAARARRRQERELQEANEQKRRQEEEKKRKVEAERTRRLRETAKERARIILELADIKEARRIAKIRKEQEIVDRENATIEEEQRKKEMDEVERQNRIKHEQALDDAQRWQEQRAREIEIEREKEETLLMGGEDEYSRVAGDGWRKHCEEVLLRRELLQYAYLQPSDFQEEDDYTAHLLWSGPKTYKSKTRRKHKDEYSMPSTEWVLEDPDEMGQFDMSRSMSDRFLTMMNVPVAQSRNKLRSSGGGAIAARSLKSASGRLGRDTVNATVNVPTSPISKERGGVKEPPVSPPADFKLTVASKTGALSPLEHKRPNTVGGSSPTKHRSPKKNVVILSPSARMTQKNKRILERKEARAKEQFTPFLRNDLLAHSISGQKATVLQSYSKFDESIGRMVEIKDENNSPKKK